MKHPADKHFVAVEEEPPEDLWRCASSWRLEGDPNGERVYWDDMWPIDCPEDLSWHRTIRNLALEAFRMGYEAAQRNAEGEE